ncbi:MAG: flavodoxin [Clostridia bacterium]
MTKKILLAYFSRKGKNYASKNNIVDLEVGNTEVIAQMIKSLTNCDLYKIESLEEYPLEYSDCVRVAMKELMSNARPQLKESLTSIEEYDAIILGYPNWCGTIPMPVCTFLTSFDFSGKTIYPYCTNEGSGMGRSEKNISKLCPNSTIEVGLPIRGTLAPNSRPILEEWLYINKLM